MDKLTPPGLTKPFELPAHFNLWVESQNTFAHLNIFRVHLQCNGLNRSLESKAFNPLKPEQATRAWLEFMGLVGNILITSVMPPDMLQKFHPVEGGGMRIVSPEKEEES